VGNFPPPPRTRTTGGKLLTKQFLLEAISLAPPGAEVGLF